MKAYVILELDADEADNDLFPKALESIKAALTEADIERVSHVHLAIGPDGLRESVKFLLGALCTATHLVPAPPDDW